MKTSSEIARISQYLENNMFKKDYPDKQMEPDFFWYVKELHHAYFKALNLNVNLREETITVFVDEVSDRKGLGGEGQVCIIHQSFEKLDQDQTCWLIGNILNIFKYPNFNINS